MASVSPGQVQSRGGCSFLLFSTQFMEQRLALGLDATENTGVLITKAMACEAVVPPPGEVSREDFRLLPTLLLAFIHSALSF